MPLEETEEGGEAEWKSAGGELEVGGGEGEEAATSGRGGGGRWPRHPLGRWKGDEAGRLAV